MGRDLTKRHSSLFKQTLINPFLFVYEIYQYGKFRELLSFLLWELLHKLRLFPKRKYLTFGTNEPLTLHNNNFTDVTFREHITHLFSSRGVRISRCHHNWKRVFINNNGEIHGCLYPNDRVLYKSIDNGTSLIPMITFPDSIKSIFVTSHNTIFVCTRGVVYKGSDNGDSFKKTLELGSSESFFRYNNGVTETPDGTVILGEYGNVWEERGWRRLAYLYSSSDDGERWDRSDFLIRQGTNKHVHMVKYSPLVNKVLVADGDNKKKLWVGEWSQSSDLQSLNWKPANRFHIQMGGYTSIAETTTKIVFGTDYQGGTNFIVETTDGRRFTKTVIPDPYRRSPIDNMVQRKSTNGTEIWANLPFCAHNGKCLLMYTANGGTSWDKVIEYKKPTHRVSLISSSNETREEIYFAIENLQTGDRVVYKVGN